MIGTHSQKPVQELTHRHTHTETDWERERERDCSVFKVLEVVLLESAIGFFDGGLSPLLSLASHRYLHSLRPSIVLSLSPRSLPALIRHTNMSTGRT